MGNNCELDTVHMEIECVCKLLSFRYSTVQCLNLLCKTVLPKLITENNNFKQP